MKGPALFSSAGLYNVWRSDMNCCIARRLLGSAIAMAAIAMVSESQEPELKRPPLLVPQTAESPAAFVPNGWRLEQETLKEVDLDRDGKTDAAFVISNGGLNADSNEPAVVKHVLVLALRGEDGKLHRSLVNDGAVLDGDEGGVFGDPFQDLSIERGAVVINHYGGSRDRWSFTHRYRFQERQWMLIGLELGSTDSLDPENHYDDQEINISTGKVSAREKGSSEGKKKLPERNGEYYELEVMPADTAPKIDGVVASGEWPGFAITLNQRRELFRNRERWRGVDDLSAHLRALRVGESLFLCAEIRDNDVTAGDAVRLMNGRGQIIKPRESKLTRVAAGYVFEGSFSLQDIARALRMDDKYVVENLEMALDPTVVYGDSQGFQLGASVEVIDLDRSVPKARGVLSTRLAGSPYPGAIRIFRKGTLVLTNDIGR
jgi:hypothetical protein